MKPPTVYDVAAEAQVSIATVSRVLTSPSAVREATRERVLQAVRALGYVPSGSARGLAAARTNVVGLLFPDHDALVGPMEPVPSSSDEVPILVDADVSPPRSPDLYYDEVLRGAEIEAWERGFALMIAAGRGDDGGARATAIAGRVDGLAVFAGALDDATLVHISRRIPVVVIAGTRGLESLDHVSASNYAGMRALVRHVLAGEQSRRADGSEPTIAYIDGRLDSPDAQDRLAGFRVALEGERYDGMPRILPGDFTREGGRAAAEQILRTGLPDLVVCANDQTALGVLDVLVVAGVEVPGVVRVTGFDGIEAGRLSSPRLTTVHQPMYDLGRLAVSTLTDRLLDPSSPPRSLTLPVEVLLRESCP